MLKLELMFQIMNQIDYSLKEKIKRLIGLMKDELVGKIMTKYVELRVKTCSYLIDEGRANKKAKGTKKCV